MRKKKNIIDKLQGLISNKYKQIEKNFDKSCVLSEDLSLIEKAFPNEDQENFYSLNDMTEEEFSKLISLLINDDESELINGSSASKFLLMNGIELVEEQLDSLRELSYRANIKKNRLQKLIDRNERALDKIEKYNELRERLNSLSNEGFIDRDTIDQIFLGLNLKDEIKSSYMDEILKFNYERFIALTKKSDIKKVDSALKEEEGLELAHVNLLTEEKLENIFTKYNYDLSIMNREVVDLLLKEGNLENIESVFSSLARNKIKFLKNDSRHGTLLAKFLLESNEELIDEGCKIFKDAHVNIKFLDNYKVIFFPSVQEGGKDYQGIDKKRNQKFITNTENNDKVENNNPLLKVAINGKHRDFIKNLEILESFGYDRKYLLEHHIRLLTMSNNMVKRHIKELELYEFPLSSSNFPLSTICSPRIMELTDSFIELGEEDYILKYSSRLTAYVDGTIERIYALKNKGLPYKSNSTQKLLAYTTNPSLPCGMTNEEMDNIVPKDVNSILNGNRYNDLLNTYSPVRISLDTLNNPFISELDRYYKNSNWSYNFDGVLISRKKLLRNFEFLMNTDLLKDEEKNIGQVLLVSAIYNSKLNREEIEKVNNGLMGSIQVGGTNGIFKK